MAANVDIVLSEALVQEGHLRKDVLDPAIMKAAQAEGGLGPVLVQRGLVSEDVILKILSERLKMERIDLGRVQVEKKALDKVPLKFAEYYRLFPVKLENRKLTVAVSFPLTIRTQDEIRAQLGCEVEIVLAKEQDVSDAVKKWYGLGAGTIEKIMQATPGAGSEAQVEPTEKVEEIEKLAEDASVIRLVNQILLDAYQKRATDIHIEPYRGKVRVRYRIDGVLYNTNVPPEIKQFIMPIISRIKIMSNLNIIEKRLPQDGRAIVRIQDETLDLRISSIPTPHGESIVMRLLPMTRLFNLEKLGLDKSELAIFGGLIEKPHGIILVTGPTGSGKSTTLYACLSMINTEERKIITLEDPVEYEMEGVTQIQVLPSIGLDFAKGLRSVLRHDPDVIMVGEVRDLETAEIAARVALTGHLVFSTLHTNDAASGVTRLVDIGVEPYLVSSSVEAFIAQRLVRTICAHCRAEDLTSLDQLKAQIVKELGLTSIKDVKFYRGKGCEKCNFTGFWGRIAIFEILLLDEEIKDMIMKRAAAGDIKRVAVKKGMRTLRQCGWHKVIAGLTTPEEILEVAPQEISMADQQSSQGPVGSGPSESQQAVFSEASLLSPAPVKRERRTYARLNVKANIRYRIIRSNAELTKKNFEPENFSIARNLSAGGLVFVAPEPIALGSIVELKIELSGIRVPIECFSRVVRVEELEPKQTYDIAVCFLDLSGADRKKLDEFIQEEIT